MQATSSAWLHRLLGARKRRCVGLAVQEQISGMEAE
jgi:hypothetical protein